METHKFHVSGMHCASCALLVEEKVCACEGVRGAKVSLVERALVIEGAFGDRLPEAIAAALSAPLEGSGYRVLAAPPPDVSVARWGEFKIALPVALALLAAFVGLQKLGLVNLIGGGELSYGAVFGVGVVASLSSCLAVVGGLVLSMSASYAKSGARVWPQVAFHASRVVSFFVFGAAVGALGAAVVLGPAATLALSILIGLALLALGLNLLDVFPWAKRFQLTAPRALSRGALGVGRKAGWLTPVALGAATFVLPCGFTQSMQIYALSTGSALTGGLTMLAFALGTLPVLALVSFSARAIRPQASGVFFKVAGLLAIAFAALNTWGGLAAAGIIPPVLNL